MEILIESFVNKLNEKIPKDETERENIIESFRIYLQKLLETIKKTENKYIKKDDESIKRILELEANEIIQMDIAIIKQILLQDKSLQEIDKISQKAFELAYRKLNGEAITEKIDFEAEKKRLTVLAESVKTFNEQKAKNLISEAILDFNYLENETSRFISLRLFYLKRAMKQKQNNVKEEQR